MRHVMENKNLTLPDLQREFLRLRGLWRDQWIGLPAVAAGCLAQLGHPRDAVPGPGERAIADCIAAVAQAIEDDGLSRSHAGNEPGYHNRLHIADTLSALACLLLLTRQECGRPLDARPDHAEWLQVLAMLAHDFLHSGLVNQFPSQIELASVDALRPLMQAAGMADDDCRQAAELILMTDPARVREHHQRMSGTPFEPGSFACMAMLLQESDILASVMPGIGVELTHALAGEWSRFSETMARSLLSAGSRITFLREFARFSSPASRRLGVPEAIAAEVAALERVARDAPL